MGNEAPPAPQPALAPHQPHARIFSDLVLTLREAPHPHYVRRENDLVTRAVIPLATALCGGTVHLRQLDGRKVREAGRGSCRKLGASGYRYDRLLGPFLVADGVTGRQGDGKLY